MFSNGKRAETYPIGSPAGAGGGPSPMTTRRFIQPVRDRNCDPYARRAQLLRRIWPLLGPAQREHVTTHCEAVSRTAGQLGYLLRVDDDELASVRLAGLLHDLGKCAVPEELIAKPDTLTDNERRVMGHHAGIGARIAAALGADARTVGYIRSHHTPFHVLDAEAADPLFSRGARVLCVADALVSMLSNRAYSPALSVCGALGELRRCAGRQFDPLVVECAQGLTGLTSAA